METEKQQAPECRSNETQAFDLMADIPFPSIIVTKQLHFYTKIIDCFSTELMTCEIWFWTPALNTTEYQNKPRARRVQYWINVPQTQIHSKFWITMPGIIHAQGNGHLRAQAYKKKQNVYCECVCCEVVDHGLLFSPLQQPPSIFITSHSDSKERRGERKKRVGGMRISERIS